MEMPPIRYAISEDGTRIAYQQIGDGPEAPLVIPGVPGGCHLVEEWSFAGYRNAHDEWSRHRAIVKYDARNHGMSDRGVPDLAFDAQYSDLLAVADAVAPERKISILSALWTTRVAVRFAAEHPERTDRLVLLWPSIRIDDGQGSFAGYETLWTLQRANWPVFIDVWSAIYCGLDDPVFATFLAGLMEASATQDDLRHSIAALSPADVTGILPLVKCPVLMMQGTGPIFSTDVIREISSLIPNAQTVVTPYRGMNPTHPEYVQQIRQFLEPPAAPTPITEAVQTLLFTDLEASTPLTQRLGDEGAQALLRQHNTVVRSALQAHGGREVKHTGDGIMAAFPSAVAAVVAATEIQSELNGSEIRVRVGLNAGEPISEDGDFFGTAVQLSARVTERAAPGQVLVTRVVADLCAGKGLRFTTLGGVALKGFDEPVELFEVGT